MQIQIEKIKTYKFSAKEFSTIKKCLIYSLHRVNCHPHSGIHSALTKENKKYLQNIKDTIHN